MSKYARIVFEVEFPENNATNPEIESLLNRHIADYLSDVHTVPIEDIEIHNQPYDGTATRRLMTRDEKEEMEERECQK